MVQMKMLTVENMTKTYGEKLLFNNISFTISERERIGIIGVNGTGKSTLLKIIAGLDTDDQGEISHSKDYTISYLAQHPEVNENLTVIEQVFTSSTPMFELLKKYDKALYDLEKHPESEDHQENLYALQQRMDAMNAWDTNANVQAILSKLGIHDVRQKMGNLSGGQKKRVALAQCLIETPDLLILDEPTNHLDYEVIGWLQDYLVRYSGAVLLVTHDRYFLDGVTNRIFELHEGNMYTYTGNYQSFLEGRAQREEEERQSQAKLRNLYRNELAWIRRGAKARSTKQKARIQRFEDIEGRLDHSQDDKLSISLSGSRLGKKVVEFTEVNKSFEDRLLIKDFSHIIQRGDHIGIVGYNGSGKSTLLNMIAGKVQPDHGEIEQGQTVKVAYYTQESEEIDLNQRMIDYVKEGAEVVQTTDGKTISVSQMLERFLFPTHTHGTPIRKLSGGERRRLYLLRLLMTSPNVLLLDEPTNDLDTETLTVLEDYIEEFPGVVITVSHDRYFLDKIAHYLFVFKGEGEVSTYLRSYSELLEESTKKKTVQKQKPKETPSQEKKKRRLSYNEKREWTELEEKIPELETELETVANDLAEVGTNYEKAQELMNREQELNEQLEQAIERWAELSELIEELNG